MEFKDILHSLEKSKEFVAWRKNHDESFLAHGFLLLDEANKDDWQIGYYNPDGTMTTFVASEKHVEVIPDQEVLRSDTDILPLQPKEVVFTVEDVLKKGREYHQLHHPREVVLKQFFILQESPTGAIYNLTFFFQSMKTLNMKFSATTGELVSHSLQSLMEFDKP